MKRGLHSVGMTVSEVLIAIVILGLVGTIVLHGLSVGERVRGRSARSAMAARSALNVAEYTWLQASRLQEIEDTTFEEETGRGGVSIVRKIIQQPDFGLLPQAGKTREIELVVIQQATADTIHRFRFLAGYGESLSQAY